MASGPSTSGRRTVRRRKAPRAGRGWILLLTPLCCGLCPQAPAEQATDAALIREGFDDPQLLKRGWYDGNTFKISPTKPVAGAGCMEYHWLPRTSTAAGTATIRRLFPPQDSVYLRFFLRLSRGWGWTGRNYHPHLINLLTTENGPYHGPAGSRLTLYVEPQEGRLRLAAQDIQNQDAPRGLTQGPIRGGYNGLFYDSRERVFQEDRWHKVEAYFRLNTLDFAGSIARSDGVARGWVDDRLVVDRDDLLFRSLDFPKMKLNQVLIAPYFGPGLLPHEQTLWLDEFELRSRRPAGPATR